MPVNSHITDPLTGQGARVLDNGELLISLYQSPPLMPQKVKVFGQMLTDDGTATGSNDLGVDGSSTSVDYWVPSHGDNDRYITKLSFVIGYGASGYLWEFADKDAALTNGVKVFYTDSTGDEVTIGNPKNNYSFLRLALSDGLVPTAWELRHLGATNDYGILVAIDLTKYVPPHGIKLDAGSSQKLSITIRDNCGDADTFNCRAFGFERVP